MMSKIIFITGTSTGFGKLAAVTLAKAGYHVIAGMRGSRGKNAAVSEELSALPNITVMEIDVTNDHSVALAFKETYNTYGRIDVLINNAAIAGYGLLEAYSLDQIREIFEVNFYGVIRTYQAVLPHMRNSREGLIINLTSGASGHTLPFMIPYLASKFSVESITEGMQEELKAYGIENVSIQPGYYPTEMNDGTKKGVNANNEEIIKAYGEPSVSQFKDLAGGFESKMLKFKMDPQAIADGILGLVGMKKGSRPLRFPIDAIAEGTDKEFIDMRASIKVKWLKKYSI
jgi:NAD(P)-dependent dehydrogenase (short-subunit alcohol dehydrogenase family)